MKERLLELWDLLTRLSFTQKVALGTLSVAVVFAAVFFYSYSQQDYDVMFSGLDESDAAAVVHNLRKQGIGFKLAEGGTTILVPRAKKEELRLDAFQEELIKSDNTLGFGVLDSLPFGMTDWQEQKYDQKIISDEVTKTLEHIQGIRKARVMLAQGSNSVFANDSTDTTASVLLIVEPGFRIPNAKVKTIRSIVARAVPGLKAENVAVADSAGNSLSDEFGSGDGASTSEADTMRRNIEKQKTKDILEMLTALVGPNNAVVKVSAKMNFDQSQSHIKRYIPSGGTAENPTGIPVSVQENTEDYNGQKESAGGVPGTTTNVPEYKEAESISTGSDDSENDKRYNNAQRITNYEISHEERTVVHAPGTVEKLTVAVAVNKVLTSSETQELSTLVSNAAGLDIKRGDTLKVSGLQFAPELQAEKDEAVALMAQSNWVELFKKGIEMGVIALLSLAALFTVFRLLKRPIDGELLAEDLYDEPPQLFADEPQELISASAIPVLEARLDPELEHMRESIATVVTKDPQEAARLLTTFMND
ncbi:MAG: flagellar basal-body MS-ring/collar protein FliF [Vampirovibrionales bacterium]